MLQAEIEMFEEMAELLRDIGEVLTKFGESKFWEAEARRLGSL